MRPSPLQITYQRNLLYAVLITVLLSGIGGFCLYRLGGPASTATRMESTSAVSMPISITDSTEVHEERRPAVTILSGMNPHASRRDGFLGFKIRVIPDAPVPEIPAPPVVALDTTLVMDNPDVTSFSPIPGPDTGIYIPADYSFGFQPDGASATESTPPAQNQPCAVLDKVDPDYPFVARDDGKEGEVAVIVPIDSAGYLTQLPPQMKAEFIQRGYHVHSVEYEISDQVRPAEVVVIKEEPMGYFFADQLLEVLIRWKFRPWIEDGMPVSSFMTIGYRYRLSGDGGYQIKALN